MLLENLLCSCIKPYSHMTIVFTVDVREILVSQKYFEKNTDLTQTRLKSPTTSLKFPEQIKFFQQAQWRNLIPSECKCLWLLIIPMHLLMGFFLTNLSYRFTSSCCSFQYGWHLTKEKYNTFKERRIPAM